MVVVVVDKVVAFKDFTILRFAFKYSIYDDVYRI